MIEIEKGIPQKPKRIKYPWKTMEIGDSFLLKAVGRSGKYKALERIAGNASKQGAILGRKFTVGMVAEGVRVWRDK